MGRKGERGRRRERKTDRGTERNGERWEREERWREMANYTTYIHRYRPACPSSDMADIP